MRLKKSNATFYQNLKYFFSSHCDRKKTQPAFRARLRHVPFCHGPVPVDEVSGGTSTLCEAGGPKFSMQCEPSPGDILSSTDDC